MISQRVVVGVIHKSFELALDTFLYWPNKKIFCFYFGLKLWENAQRVRNLNLVLLISMFH